MDPNVGNHKPKLFIGSSTESLDIVDVLKIKLDSVANVISWNDPAVFPPGEFLLDSLTGLVPSFDFAVLIFGRDDVITSRGRVADVPRDNVLFELGLFMSQLDRSRTFIIRPEGGTPYHVLNDLNGLTLLTYPEGPKLRKNVTVKDQRMRTVHLKGALQPASDQIAKSVQRQGVRNVVAEAARFGPQSVLDIGEQLFELIATTCNAGSGCSVDNLAHDMGVTWPLLKHRLLDNPSARDVRWRTLIADPDSPQIKEVEGAGISTAIARARIEEVKREYVGSQAKWRARNLRFECRAYMPVHYFHGFLVNGDTLFLGMAKRTSGGQLEAAANPYWKVVSNTAYHTRHSVDAFQSWFEYEWHRSRIVCGND